MLKEWLFLFMVQSYALFLVSAIPKRCDYFLLASYNKGIG